MKQANSISRSRRCQSITWWHR